MRLSEETSPEDVGWVTSPRSNPHVGLVGRLAMAKLLVKASFEKLPISSKVTLFINCLHSSSGARCVLLTHF